jgi:hypothetical protein
MTLEREIRVVVYRSDDLEPERMEGRVRLTGDADFPDFIEALKRESPDLYEEVRRRVMRAAGRVLAYGHDDPLLVSIDRKLAEGGTLVFPAEGTPEEDANTSEPALEPTRSTRE